MTEKLQKELNVQINAEMWSSNLYLSMAFYLKNKGLDGCANWLMKQSQEELNHAYEIADYLNKRGEKAEVGMVDVVPTGWGDVAEVFKNVYDHECHVSKLIDELVDVASAEKDKATQDFLWGFVREHDKLGELLTLSHCKRLGREIRKSRRGWHPLPRLSACATQINA